MTSRTNVRPRPLELSKQLPIVRELSELDPPTEGAKDVLYTVEVGDSIFRRSMTRSFQEWVKA